MSTTPPVPARLPALLVAASMVTVGLGACASDESTTGSQTTTSTHTMNLTQGTNTSQPATPGAGSGSSDAESGSPTTSPTTSSPTTTAKTTPSGDTKPADTPAKHPVSPGTSVKYGTPATVNFATRDGNRFGATVTVKKLERIPNAQIKDPKTKESGADRYRIYYDVELVDAGAGKPVLVTPQQLKPAGVANKHKGAFVYTSEAQGCPDQAPPLRAVGDKAVDQCQAFDIAGPEITDVVLNPDGILNWVTWTK